MKQSSLKVEAITYYIYDFQTHYDPSYNNTPNKYERRKLITILIDLGYKYKQLKVYNRPSKFKPTSSSDSSEESEQEGFYDPDGIYFDVPLTKNDFRKSKGIDKYHQKVFLGFVIAP